MLGFISPLPAIPVDGCHSLRTAMPPNRLGVCPNRPNVCPKRSNSVARGFARIRLAYRSVAPDEHAGQPCARESPNLAHHRANPRDYPVLSLPSYSAPD